MGTNGQHRRVGTFRRQTKKRKTAIVGSLVTAGLLFGGGAAVAAWIINTGTGYATTAQGGTWAVSVSPPTNGPLAPTGSSVGTSTEQVPVSVTNSTATGQTLATGITVSFNSDANGGVFDELTNAYVDACPAANFSADASTFNTANGGSSVAAGSSASGAITVTIADAAPTACEGLEPEFTVVAS
jgi:hypothetical protein